jgi:DNA-binding MarR family transcriptional regulator
LTEKGLKTFNNTHKSQSIKRIMSVLSDEEQQQLISILEKIVRKAEKY